MLSSSRRRASAALALAAPLLLLTGTSSAEPGPFPGLPVIADPPPPFPETVGTDLDRNLTSWLNTTYTGVTGSARAQQWVELPTRSLATNVTFATCSGTQGDAPCPYPIPDDTVQSNLLDVAAFIVSPEGSGSLYGEGPVIPVRTVAFGSIPVEIEIQLAQALGPDGLPVPLVAGLEERNWSSTGFGGPTDMNTMEEGSLRGPMVLHVRGLAVDGVDLSLGSCVTESFDVVATSAEATGPIGQEYTWIDPDQTVYGFSGGGMQGMVDIPGFVGCRTAAGDDLSGVLTSVIAGPGNPLRLRIGALASCLEMDGDGNAIYGPVSPGADLPSEAGCFDYEQVPGDPRWNAIPLTPDAPAVPPGGPEQ